MASPKYELPQVETTPACVHYRSKAMYVNGHVDHPASEEDSGYCWCNLTQHTIGPDDKNVIRLDCTARRQCFQETR